MVNEEHSEYGKYYSEGGFWKTAKKYAMKIGCTGMNTAFSLYCALQEDNLPAKTKAIILGALGYLVLPLDVIPDILPIGLSDDLAVLAAAFAAVAMYIDDEVKAKARQKVRDLFGDGCEEEETVEELPDHTFDV